MRWLAIACGAAVGAPARFLLDTAISRHFHRRFPWGTVTANITGSALIGCLGALLATGRISPTFYALLATGFCGAFTTFSTFVWETLALGEDVRPLVACGHLALTLVVGIGVAYGTFELAWSGGAVH